MYALRKPPSSMRCTREVAQYEERLTELATKENHHERNMLNGPDCRTTSVGFSSHSDSSKVSQVGVETVRIDRRPSMRDSPRERKREREMSRRGCLMTSLGGAYRRALARDRASRGAVIQEGPTKWAEDEGNRVHTAQREGRAKEGQTRAERISCHGCI